MAKRDLLKMPDDFEGNMRALLATTTGIPRHGEKPGRAEEAQEGEEEAATAERADGPGWHLRVPERAGYRTAETEEAESVGR